MSSSAKSKGKTIKAGEYNDFAIPLFCTALFPSVPFSA